MRLRYSQPPGRLLPGQCAEARPALRAGITRQTDTGHRIVAPAMAAGQRITRAPPSYGGALAFVGRRCCCGPTLPAGVARLRWVLLRCAASSAEVLDRLPSRTPTLTKLLLFITAFSCHTFRSAAHRPPPPMSRALDTEKLPPPPACVGQSHTSTQEDRCGFFNRLEQVAGVWMAFCL